MAVGFCRASSAAVPGKMDHASLASGHFPLLLAALTWPQHVSYIQRWATEKTRGEKKEKMQNKVAWGKEALHCREKECINTENFIFPCVHAILHTYTLKQTIAGKINTEFKEILKKSLCFWNLPFFNVHYGAPIPSATWNLQSVFLLPGPSAPLVHQSSENSFPLHSYRISSSKCFHRQTAGSYFSLSAGDF